MKQYTHAWLAFRAVEYLETKPLNDSNRRYASGLAQWFMDHRDGVIQGAWYPDAVIKDMSKSHVLKISPATEGSVGSRNGFGKLPVAYMLTGIGKGSALWDKPYLVDRNDNLPERSEAIAHSIIDALKMQHREEKGSPISPTVNHVATLFFMLSHYVADGHVPMHCDARSFSSGVDIHGHIEKKWNNEVEKFYEIDKENERFIYNPGGYPKRRGTEADFNGSILRRVEETLRARSFKLTWGSGNGNVLDFMSSLSGYSYLASYAFLPEGFDETNVNKQNWKKLPGRSVEFDDLSVAVLSDAVESIARVWLRVWRKYKRWEKG